MNNIATIEYEDTNPNDPVLPQIREMDGEDSYERGGSEFYFKELRDGSLTESDLPHNLELKGNSRKFYTDSEQNDGTAHPFWDDAKRTPKLDAFLKSLDGRGYRIDFAVILEACRSGRFFQMLDAAFATEDDLESFRKTFGLNQRKGDTGIKATIRKTSAIITKLSYTQPEYEAEMVRIAGLAKTENWTTRRLAAFRAHAKRRLVG